MRLVYGAVRLCRMPIFIQFLATITDRPMKTEADAADFVRSWCGIASRGELRRNDEARKRWIDLVTQFNDSIQVIR